MAAKKKYVPKKRYLPDEKRKDKRVYVPVSPNAAERYRELSEKVGIPVTQPARRGLEVWESMGGRLLYPIRVLGYIPGGPGCVVRPLDDCFVNVDEEFATGLSGEEYFLIVDGDSMCSTKGDSIESGEYALFRPDREPCGKIAHVEWENASGERECTLKKFVCEEDGTVTLKPSNPKFKPLVKRRDEVVVRGVFVRKWSPKVF